MIMLFLKWLTVATSLLLQLGGLAFAASSEAPILWSHSGQDLTVYQGDFLTLEVQAGGQEVKYNWSKNDAFFCLTPACEIDTGNWSLGRHNVVVTAANSLGTRSLQINIRIVRPPLDHRPANVRPRLVAAADLIGLTAKDWIMKLLYGHGVRELEGEARDIGKLPDLLTGNEALQTGAQSALEFGRSGAAAYVLAADTRIKLSTDTDSKRVILLTQGNLRARNLDTSRTGWTIKVGDIGRIETNPEGDILVQVANGGTVALTVLRGSAKLFWAAKPEGAETVESVEVEQGYSLSFDPSDTESVVLPAPANFSEIQPLVVATGAQYLPENLLNWPEKGAFYLGVPAPKTAAAAIEQARKFNHDRDFVSAIESIAPYWSQIRNTADGNTVLAEAYVGLFMFDRATILLGDAIQLDSSSATPYFVLGSIKLKQKHWRQAASAFEAAAKRNYPDQKTLNYQLGIAQYHRNIRDRAKSAFTRVQWDGYDDETSRSAREYLTKLNADTWYEATTSFELFYDSRILRVSSLKLALANGEVLSNYGSGYHGDVRLSLWPYRSDSAVAQFIVEADITDYIKPTNSDFALMKQRIGFDSGIGFGGTRNDRLIIFGLAAFAGVEALGGQKNLTRFDGTLSLWSPKLYDLRAAMERSQALDAAPGRERFIEPIRWELAGKEDYSALLPYYDLSAGFQSSRRWSFKMGVRVGEGKYRAATMQNQNFRDSGARLESVYEPNPRRNMNLALVYHARNFPNSSDNRSDSSINLRVKWHWWITDALAQQIEASYGTQTSSRALNNFKRNYLAYKLTMNI